MERKKVTLQVKRHFTEELKRSIVGDYERGKYTVLELCRLHNLSSAALYDWIYRFSTYNKKKIIVVEMEDSSEHKVKQLEQKVKELERIVGQKQLKIDFLEKMIDLAEEKFEIEIKKNSDTPPSDGSRTKADKKAAQ